MKTKIKVKDILKKLTKNKIAVVITTLLLLLTIYLVADQYVILTPEYTVKSAKVDNDITIAVISDLHSMNYGFDNKVIIEKVKSKSPDIIAVVGDMIDEYDEDTSSALNVMKALPKIAPTYYVVGNHDTLCESYYEFKYESQKAGVNLLLNTKEDITVNGNDVSLLGIIGYSFGEVENRKYTELMEEFCESDSLKILLCHYPEYSMWFFEKDKYYEYDFDLMLSGHTHGGLVRLPFIGGVIAPNQGLFPEYTKGLYYVDKSNKNPYYMLVTGGLGQDRRCLRVNNFPEISFVNIVKQR